MSYQGKIIIIVAPSGTGKSSLIQKLKCDLPQLQESVSYTTRSMRTGEVQGKTYNFISEEEFLKRKEENEFLEWALVHSNYYGTSKKFVENILRQGGVILFDLDVQGADAMKQYFQDRAKIIFIEPPSLEALEARLFARATDSPETIKERLNNAKNELQRKNDYDYLILNDQFDEAYCKLKKVCLAIINDN